MNSRTNPYTLTFGRIPPSLVQRDFQLNDIIDCFLSDSPIYQMCMIAGIRGSGKTVALTTVANRFEELGGWIIVNLNPERNLIYDLMCELSSRKELLNIFNNAKLNISTLGIDIEISNRSNNNDVTLLRKMLQNISKSGRRVLVTVDEVTPNKNIKEFASQIQIFIRENINIFLLMSGLYENVYNLQNESTLTFLYRAPKVQLNPLNEILMAKSYRENLDLDKQEAETMARFTKGYAFAFQVLGYLCFKNDSGLEDNIEEFDAYMSEYVYEKIWSECSNKDKLVLSKISNYSKKVEDILSQLTMSSSLFSVYRDRLIKKGLVVSKTYGMLELTLPRFEEYMKMVL